MVNTMQCRVNSICRVRMAYYSAVTPKLMHATTLPWVLIHMIIMDFELKILLSNYINKLWLNQQPEIQASMCNLLLNFLSMYVCNVLLNCFLLQQTMANWNWKLKTVVCKILSPLLGHVTLSPCLQSPYLGFMRFYSFSYSNKCSQYITYIKYNLK